MNLTGSASGPDTVRFRNTEGAIPTATWKAEKVDDNRKIGERPFRMFLLVSPSAEGAARV